LTAAALLVLARKLLAKTGSARPIGVCGTQDTVDAYIEEQRHRLKIPGVSWPSSRETGTGSEQIRLEIQQIA
jgi:hypothetical protein